MLVGTDAVLAKEEARIALKRQQNELRRQRFLNARTRIMGVDVDSLDAQVADMKQRQSDGKESERIERLRQMEIDRVLEAAAEEERQMREFNQQQIKRDWERSIDLKKSIVPEEDPNPRYSGPSACQNFAGNDPNKAVRVRAQQEQMRSWIQEQVAEKSYLARLDKDSNKSYADMLRAIEDIRDVAEKEEADMRKYLQRTVKEQNDMLAANRNKRWADEKLSWSSLPNEIKNAATSLDLKDNQDLAIDETGRIVRKDMFRGFNDAQKRRIIQENEALLAQKRAAMEAERGSENQWLIQQMMTQAAMEQANIDQMRMRGEETMLNLEIIKRQKELQQQKKDASVKARFGGIEPGFFDKFGTNCR